MPDCAQLRRRFERYGADLPVCWRNVSRVTTMLRGSLLRLVPPAFAFALACPTIAAAQSNYDREARENALGQCRDTAPDIDFEWLNETYADRRWFFEPEDLLTYPEEAEYYSWAAVEDATTRHMQLRESSGRALPFGETRILFYNHSWHWAERDWSLVATRSELDGWSVSWVSSLNTSSEFAEFEVTDYVLEPEVAAALDTVLADPCLLAEPSQSAWAVVSSSTNWRWTLQFEGIAEDRRIAGAHGGFGRIGLVLELLRIRPEPLLEDVSGG